MGKFGSFKYGDGTKYGAGDWDANLLWTFIVDWTGSGYTGANEAEQMIDLTVRRGRQKLLDVGGLAPFGVGKAFITLDNSDGRYDPFNASSPLYPNVTPGKFIRLEVRDEANTTDYGIMRGTIDDIVCLEQGGRQVTYISVVDGLAWLAGQTINVGLNTDIDKSVCVHRILTYADWPREGKIEWPATISADTDEFEYWWAWNQNALRALNEFNQAEWAVAFHNYEGSFMWRPRDYTHRKTQAIDQAVLLADIGRPNPWEVVRNTIRIQASPKVEDVAVGIIWQLQTVPALADGETLAIEPIFKYSEWFKICGGSVTFAFTVNAQADGGGADLSASCTLTYNAQIAEGAQLRLQNNSGTAGYITLMTAIGDAIYSPSIDIREAADTPSQASYGPKTLAITSRWVVDTVFAQTQAAWLLSEFKDPQMYPIIQMEQRPGYQYYLDLYDRVELTAAELGIDANYRVGHIEHQWLNPTGQAVRTTMHLEPYMVQT